MAAKRRGASIVFVDSKRRVLLYLRDNKPGLPYPGCWDLLGGRVEPGESPEDCIKREVREEIEFDLKEPQLFNVYEMDDRVEHTYWISHDLNIATTPLHEGQKLEWFSQQDLTALPDSRVGFGFKAIVLDFLCKQPWTRYGE